MTERSKNREYLFFILGITYGGILGICGNIFATWFYDNLKDLAPDALESTVLFSTVILFGTIIAGFILFIS